MASKFMAFENVASTSSASMDEDVAGERIEMNTSQYPNYQTNHQMHDGAESSNTYGDGVSGGGSGGGGAETCEQDDLNENFQEKTEKDVGYRKFIYNNSEQFKCICGGLLLLMGSGIHIVWGIFRVFYLYKCEEENSFFVHLVIWSWYIGAIAGCCCAGYAVLKFRKGHIYAFGGVLLAFSGILLMISDNNINLWILTSRAIGGYAQGLTYVIVIVHASENATKEFRELLMMIVGAVINYSILVSVLSFFHTEGFFKTGYLNGFGLVAFGVITVMITMKHATETIPFILQTNGSELDALQTMAKLKKQPVAAPSVHRDFLLLKNQVQDEIDQYGAPNFLKVLLPENRKSLIFCCYGRLCSVLSFNLPLIVMIMLVLRDWVDPRTKELDTKFEVCKGQCEYLGYYNRGELEEFWNCRWEHENRSMENALADENMSENKENSRPKRFAIETPAFFDIEDVEPEVYSMWMKDIKSRSQKRDAKDEKNDENKNVEPVKNEGDKTSKDKKESELQKENDSHAKEEPKDRGETNSNAEKNPKNKNVEPVKNEGDKTSENEKKPVSQKEKDSHAKEEPKERGETNSNAEKNPKNKNVEPVKSEGDKTGESEKKSESQKKKDSKNKGNSGTKENPKDQHEKPKSPNEKNGKTEEKSEGVKKNVLAGTSGSSFGFLVAILHKRELTLILLAWFVFGTITTLTLYYFSMKRFIYRISLVLSSVLVFTGLLHSFGTLSTIFHISLIIYFNYVTIPIDVFGHCILAEAFPITLKAFSIASVAIVEHLVHILLITLYLTAWFRDTVIVFMCVVAFVSHEIARNLPEKANLPLGEARQQYQNIDLMLFNDPKSGYNQQQEFI